jgi:hypothetical protein
VPALPVQDFASVSKIGAATGGGPYKRMKQPCLKEDSPLKRTLLVLPYDIEETAVPCPYN